MGRGDAGGGGAGGGAIDGGGGTACVCPASTGGEDKGGLTGRVGGAFFGGGTLAGGGPACPANTGVGMVVGAGHCADDRCFAAVAMADERGSAGNGPAGAGGGRDGNGRAGGGGGGNPCAAAAFASASRRAKSLARWASRSGFSPCGYCTPAIASHP